MQLLQQYGPCHHGNTPGHLWSFRGVPHPFNQLFLSPAWVFDFQSPTVLLISLQHKTWEVKMSWQTAIPQGKMLFWY